MSTHPHRLLRAIAAAFAIPMEAASDMLDDMDLKNEPLRIKEYDGAYGKGIAQLHRIGGQYTLTLQTVLKELRVGETPPY